MDSLVSHGNTNPEEFFFLNLIRQREHCVATTTNANDLLNSYGMMTISICIAVFQNVPTEVSSLFTYSIKISSFLDI